MTHDVALNADLVPNTNRETYAAIYAIEVALRELIIETLSNLKGPSWWKQCIPGGDALTKYKEAKKYERNTPWVQNVPHHPLYYLDFPELTQIIERGDNWENAFKHIFGSRKEVVLGSLRRLEPIRNKIAHNRKATASDAQIAGAVYLELESNFGTRHINELVMRCTAADDLPKRLEDLQGEASTAIDACRRYEPLPSLEKWEAIKNQWWFDPDYLEHDLAPVHTYFQSLELYNSLPRRRGSGHVIETWVAAHNIENKYVDAATALTKLLKSLADV